MRHKSTNTSSADARKLHVRKVSDPGLYPSTEMAPFSSATERADFSRTLTAEVSPVTRTVLFRIPAPGENGNSTTDVKQTLIL